jgi:hypothetical protein
VGNHQAEQQHVSLKVAVIKKLGEVTQKNLTATRKITQYILGDKEIAKE